MNTFLFYSSFHLILKQLIFHLVLSFLWDLAWSGHSQLVGSVSRSRFSPSIHESEECIPHHFIHHESLELATLLWEVCWEVLSTHSLACCLNSWLRPPKGSHSLSIEQQGKGSCFNEESFNSQTGKFLLPKWSCIVYFNVTMRGILLEHVLNSSCSCKRFRCPLLRNEWFPTSLDEGISHTAYSEEFHKNTIKFNYMATHFPICQLDYLYCQCVLSPVIPVER